MTELLPYYERELLFIRHMAAEFAEKYPDRAGALRIHDNACPDPDVERLMEAFALIAARVQHKIDDEFPEITEALLDMLYPHYLRPVPPMAIAQMDTDPDQRDSAPGYVVPRGSCLYTRQHAGTICRFRTCYPLRLWPIEVTAAAFMRSADLADRIASSDSPYLFRLQLQCRGNASLSRMGLRDLRFYLGGDSQAAHTAYELVCNSASGVIIRTRRGGKLYAEIALGPDAVRPVGFGRDEGLLPYTDRSFLGFRLLQEYFAFPEKFLFFDIEGFGRLPDEKLDQQFEILIPICSFERADRARLLEQAVDAAMFQLGCTPIVNLFERCAEPIRLSHTASEYPVLADVHFPLATEVYSVDRVASITSDAEETKVYRQFYSLPHSERESTVPLGHAVRRASHRNGDRGTDVYLSLVDFAFDPAQPPSESLTVHVTCTNRDFVERIPVSRTFGELEAEAGALLRIRFVYGPTPTVRPPLRRGLQWRLISHMALNHLSIVESGLPAFQEILQLYDFGAQAGFSRHVSGITKLGSRPKIARVNSRCGLTFCPGMHVDLEFDEENFAGSGVFLFASVLERFLGLYSAINSFTELTVRTRQRKGDLRRWLPRAGEQIVA
jgi:type VI secretion system protein ImpG